MKFEKHIVNCIFLLVNPSLSCKKFNKSNKMVNYTPIRVVSENIYKYLIKNFWNALICVIDIIYWMQIINMIFMFKSSCWFYIEIVIQMTKQ